MRQNIVFPLLLHRGRTEQSSKNWQKRRHSVLQYSWTRLATTGLLLQYELVKVFSFSRVGARAGQLIKIWKVSSGVWQSGESLQSPWVLLDQWLHSASVLYRPEINLACTVAITTFVWEAAAVLQRGWEQVSDMKEVWKNCNDFKGVASYCSFCSQ